MASGSRASPSPPLIFRPLSLSRPRSPCFSAALQKAVFWLAWFVVTSARNKRSWRATKTTSVLPPVQWWRVQQCVPRGPRAHDLAGGYRAITIIERYAVVHICVTAPPKKSCRIFFVFHPDRVCGIATLSRPATAPFWRAASGARGERVADRSKHDITATWRQHDDSRTCSPFWQQRQDSSPGVQQQLPSRTRPCTLVPGRRGAGKKDKRRRLSKTRTCGWRNRRLGRPGRHSAKTFASN